MKKIESARGKHYLSRAKRIHYTLDKNSMDMADITEVYLLESIDKRIEIRRGIADVSDVLIAPAVIKGDIDIFAEGAASISEDDFKTYLYPVLSKHLRSCSNGVYCFDYDEISGHNQKG